MKLISTVLLTFLSALCLEAWVFLPDELRWSWHILWGIAPTALTLWYVAVVRHTVTRHIQALLVLSQNLEKGRLAESLPTICSQDEIGRLAQSLNSLHLSMSSMVANIRSNAALLEHSSETVARSSQDLSARAEQQAASLEETSASLQSLQHQVLSTAETAAMASERALQIRAAADEGTTLMATAVTLGEQAKKQALQMKDIVSLIDALAFQTNLLALNAAVEAARAGDAGRGFAVVATEVRALANRSASASKEIRQLIDASVVQAQSSEASLQQVQQAVASIVQGIHTVSGFLQTIAQAAAGQRQGLSEVAEAAQRLDSVIQHNASLAETAYLEAQYLHERAQDLMHSVSVYELKQGTAEEAYELVMRALSDMRNPSSRSVIARVNGNGASFSRKDMYVFVLNGHGEYEAFAGNPSKVGSSVYQLPGVDGAALMQAIVNQCATGGGWVEYSITNPQTGRVQTKISYVCPVGEVFLGCGVYKH